MSAVTEFMQIEDIISNVAHVTGISAAAICGPRRDEEVIEARHIAMYLANRDGASYARIGRAMRRDHTTVMAGVRSIKAKMAEKPELRSVANMAKEYANHA